MSVRPGVVITCPPAQPRSHNRGAVRNPSDGASPCPIDRSPLPIRYGRPRRGRHGHGEREGGCADGIGGSLTVPGVAPRTAARGETGSGAPPRVRTGAGRQGRAPAARSFRPDVPSRLLGATVLLRTSRPSQTRRTCGHRRRGRRVPAVNDDSRGRGPVGATGSKAPGTGSKRPAGSWERTADASGRRRGDLNHAGHGEQRSASEQHTGQAEPAGLTECALHHRWATTLQLKLQLEPLVGAVLGVLSRPGAGCASQPRGLAGPVAPGRLPRAGRRARPRWLDVAGPWCSGYGGRS